MAYISKVGKPKLFLISISLPSLPNLLSLFLYPLLVVKKTLIEKKKKIQLVSLQKFYRQVTNISIIKGIE